MGRIIAMNGSMPMENISKKRRRGRPSGGGRLPKKAVLEARAKGVSVIELAKRYGVHRQSIYNLIWEARKR